MTFRPKIRATSSQTNNEKTKRDRTKVPDAHLHLAKIDYLTEIDPGVILLSISSLQYQCLVQQVQERDSWLTRGRSAGATAPMILSSRPSATLEANTRADQQLLRAQGGT